MHISTPFKKLSIPVLMIILSVAIAAGVTAAWLLGPGLIKAAYQSRSFGLLNLLISGQQEVTLKEYLAALNIVISISTFFSILCIAVLLHMALVVAKASSGRDSITVLNYIVRPNFERVGILAMYTFVFFAGAYLLIVSPCKTFLNLQTHDTFIFFDGAYRLSQGQVPHLDFHTPMGALTYALPYLGLRITHSFAGSMEIISLIVAVLLIGATFEVLSTRYSVAPSILTLLFLFLIVVVPMNLGAVYSDMTHAMYYNRYGWVGLTVLFLYFVEPREKSKLIAFTDMAIVAGILAFLFYMKITYFLVGLAFLPIMALVSCYNRRVAAGALGLLAVVIIAVEFTLGFTASYVKDIIMAIESSGAIHKGLGTLFKMLIGGLFFEYLVALMATGLVFRSHRLTLAEIVFISFVLASGIAIMDQNPAQDRGVVTLLAVLLWAHETMSRKNLTEKRGSNRAEEFLPASVVIFGLLVLFVAGPLTTRTLGMLYYAKEIRQVENRKVPAALSGIRIGEKTSLLAEVLTDQNRIELFNKVRNSYHKQPLTQGEYLETVLDGVQLLERVDRNSKSVIVFDMVNPFTFIMSMKPPQGDYSCMVSNRGISKKNHLPAGQLFQSADYVLSPKFPMEWGTNKFLHEIYGAYLHQHYRVQGETDYWVLYVKK